MKVRATYNSISNIPQVYKNEFHYGRWNNWSRVLIFKVNNRYSVVTANMLECFMATFLKILQIDYFKLKLGGKVKVLDRRELNVTDRKILPAIKPAPIAPASPNIQADSSAAKPTPAAAPAAPAAQKPMPQLPIQPKNILAPDLDPTQLTPEQIKRMSPDQQGALIDNFARRGNAGSNLNQAQLKGMLRSQNLGPIQIINKQELGLGHCGRYCVNNALQQEFLSKEEFLRLTGEVFVQRTGMSPNDAKTLLANNEDFAVDVGILEHILNSCNMPIQHRIIRDLPGYSDSKQQALEQAIGNAKWVIIGNTGSDREFDRRAHVYDMPSSGNAPYPLASGHFVALRKDDRGEWWYIDSRGYAPENIALAVIPSTCTLIVPR